MKQQKTSADRNKDSRLIDYEPMSIPSSASLIQRREKESGYRQSHIDVSFTPPAIPAIMPSTGKGIIQRKVYINKDNASKLPGFTSQKLDTKKALSGLLGTDSKSIVDDRQWYLYGADDPRIPLVTAEIVKYIKQHYKLNVDESVITAAVTKQLSVAAAQEAEYALNNMLDTMMEDFVSDTKKWITAKEVPAMSVPEGGKFSDFIGSAYDQMGKTPGHISHTKKSDVVDSFTNSGQQVNTIAFLDKTPIGAFKNKKRDKTVLDTLSGEGFSVPSLEKIHNAHSHSEDETIYEILFGGLKDMVAKKIESDKLTTITFMISDLTCNHNQVQESDQRPIRSCAENIVEFAQRLRKQGKDLEVEVQVQVIFGRPYNLDHYKKGGAKDKLGDNAEKALQLFKANNIRVKSIKQFFQPCDIDSSVLADPLAYGIEEPKTPPSFDPSNTPFPSLSTSGTKKRKLKSDESKKEEVDEGKEKSSEPKKGDSKLISVTAITEQLLLGLKLTLELQKFIARFIQQNKGGGDPVQILTQLGFQHHSMPGSNLDCALYSIQHQLNANYNINITDFAAFSSYVRTKANLPFNSMIDVLNSGKAVLDAVVQYLLENKLIIVGVTLNLKIWSAVLGGGGVMEYNNVATSSGPGAPLRLTLYYNGINHFDSLTGGPGL
jgi:hypothetical protein